MRISSSLRKGKSTKARITSPVCLISHYFFFFFFRMPNIRKLALPQWCHLSENSYQFAFRQWKNLQTLIIDASLTWTHTIQASGESCINLTNLKIMGWRLTEVKVEEIVRLFPNLKNLSLRICDIIDIRKVLPLITSLENLTILNLSHCRFIQRCGYTICSRELETILLESEALIMSCLNVDCKFCEKAYGIVRLHAFFKKNWRNDEIEEFEFWNVVRICWWTPNRLPYTVYSV